MRALTAAGGQTIDAQGRTLPEPIRDTQVPTEQKAGWRAMAEYPRSHDPVTNAYWGPPVLVRVPASTTFRVRTHYVAHLEADMWLTRSGSDPVAWDELHASPEAWMPIEGVADAG